MQWESIFQRNSKHILFEVQDRVREDRKKKQEDERGTTYVEKKLYSAREAFTPLQTKMMKYNILEFVNIVEWVETVNLVFSLLYVQTYRDARRRCEFEKGIRD